MDHKIQIKFKNYVIDEIIYYDKDSRAFVLRLSQCFFGNLYSALINPNSFSFIGNGTFQGKEGAEKWVKWHEKRKKITFDEGRVSIIDTETSEEIAMFTFFRKEDNYKNIKELKKKRKLLKKQVDKIENQIKSLSLHRNLQKQEI